MKLIMTACIDFEKSEQGKWYLTDFVDTDISCGVPYQNTPCDWREIIKHTAEALGWKTRGFDLDTVEGLVYLLEKEDRLRNSKVLDDYFGEIVGLPENAVVIGGSIYDREDREPLMVFWEEDCVHPSCLDCCSYSRRVCKGKNTSLLIFCSDTLVPECFAECSEVCPYDGKCVTAEALT